LRRRKQSIYRKLTALCDLSTDCHNQSLTKTYVHVFVENMQLLSIFE